MVRQWLLANAPGFAALPSRDRRAILDFVLVWTLFEAKVMDNRAQVDRICAKVDQWDAAGSLDAEQYAVELAYFRRRYFARGDFTDRFHALNLRPADQPDLVRAVISSLNDEPRDRVLTVLLIVWRFRNNLFHGGKWAYWLRGQRGNFTHACKVLMKVIERHGDLAA